MRKKTKTYDSKIFFSPCFLSDAKNELSSQQSAQQYATSYTSYVQKNIYQISTKITKRSKNDSTPNFETWKIENISHLYASPLLFHQYHTSTSERGRRGRESKATWSARGNRNNSMTEGDAGNQTRSSSPSFNEFHALLCPYNFAQARVHAYPTRSSR